MSRYIDADAYATEMKVRQDALKELMDDAVALDNWEMYDGLSRALSVFVEAKLTLDAMPTVDAVKHGEWMETDALPHRIYCSKCYATYIPNKEWVAWKENMIPGNYCPNCGAKMKGEADG